MSEIANSNNNNSGSIILGDESSEQAISFKMAQAFYSEITGKSERITEDFAKSFILTIENIEQLHKRIIQSTTPYTLISSNASFSVEYQNESSERFSSIDRLKLHAGSKAFAVEEVDISYNFLIILPETKTPQEYKMNIRLFSRVVKLENIRERLSSMPISIPLWQFDTEVTCRVTIDFIDITVANAFMSVIKDWNDSLDEVNTSSYVKKIRNLSKFMPSAFKYGLLATGCYYTYIVVNDYFINPEPKTTAMFVLIAYIFNFLLWKIGAFTGTKSRNHFHQLYEVSYINFSHADKKLANQCATTKNKNKIKSLGFLASAIFVSVISSTLSEHIFKIK